MVRLVRTLASTRRTTNQWAAGLEVQALLRAHRVAGDLDLGERFLVMVDAVRYPAGGIRPRPCRRSAASKPASMPSGCPRSGPEHPLKLGRGGPADVEWTVQLLQLRFAGQDSSLHNTSTLETLDAIAAAELIAEDEVDQLRDAWLLPPGRVTPWFRCAGSRWTNCPVLGGS